MKSFILRFLIGFSISCESEAATVLLQFDSIVQDMGSGPAAPNGTAIHVNIFYETPKDPNVTSEPETTYFSFDAITSVTVGDRAYSMQFMRAFIGADPDVPGWRVQLGLVDVLTPHEPNIGGMGLYFRSSVKFFDDATRLPESLSEWNLQATDFSMRFSTNPPIPLVSQRWEVTSRTISNLSLGIVPEPSVAALALCGVAFLTRQRRRR